MREGLGFSSRLGGEMAGAAAVALGSMLGGSVAVAAGDISDGETNGFAVRGWKKRVNMYVSPARMITAPTAEIMSKGHGRGPAGRVPEGVTAIGGGGGTPGDSSVFSQFRIAVSNSSKWLSTGFSVASSQCAALT